MMKIKMKKFMTFMIMIIIFMFSACGKTETSSDNNKYDIFGKVIKVADGDTFTMSVGGKKIKIRMYGIDAPESSQEYGQRSRRELLNIIMDQNVGIKIKDKDKYGRTVGEVYYKDRNINIEMLEKGNAWFYEYHAKKENAYRQAYEHAKSNRLGLWNTRDPQDPREYRKAHKSQ